jgi:iron complex outermembrane receptor protein
MSVSLSNVRQGVSVFATTSFVLAAALHAGDAISAPETPAFAAVDEASSTPSVDSSDASATATDPSGELQEITVTANKRRESLQSVPIAVTAVTAETAAAIGVTDISSLQTTVPGLEFPRLFSGTSPALRGIGTSFGIGGQENVVAIYVDDVYIASPSAATFTFNNIDQIEVLKGPQGTLFGRNAMAGVINVTTLSPGPQPKADLSVGYANFNTVSGSSYVSYPISDKVSADLAFTGDNQADGWGKNLYTGRDAFTEKNASVRTKWVIKPDADTTLTLIADYAQSRYDEGIAMRPVEGALFPNGQVFQGYYNVNENVTSYVDTKQGGVSAKIDRDLGWANLISVTAFRRSLAFNNADEDQTVDNSQYLPIHDDLNSTSEELRLVSPEGGQLHWLAGLFYFHDLSTMELMDEGTALGGLTLNEDFKQGIDSYAGFGQGTYDLPDQFHLTLGLRYTYDELRKSARESLLGTATSAAQTTESAWTYKINLAKDLTSNVSAYVGWSTGFKGGVFNSQDIFAPAVKPEKLDDVEAGFKSELLERRLRLNAAVYHYDYKNLQVTSLTRAVTGQTSSTLANAAEATNTGFELDVEAQPLSRLTIRGGIEAMHSRFKSFPNATISIPVPTGGNTTTSGSAAGLQTPHSPDFSSNLGGEYRTSTTHGDLISAVNYSYTSAFAWDADNRLKQHPYGLVNGSLRWIPSGNRWDVMLWVKNLNGAEYSIYTTANVVGDEESPAPPRTFGLTVSTHFL